MFVRVSYDLCFDLPGFIEQIAAGIVSENQDDNSWTEKWQATVCRSCRFVVKIAWN
jgi:hypothetical protein